MDKNTYWAVYALKGQHGQVAKVLAQTQNTMIQLMAAQIQLSSQMKQMLVEFMIALNKISFV